MPIGGRFHPKRLTTACVHMFITDCSQRVKVLEVRCKSYNVFTGIIKGAGGPI